MPGSGEIDSKIQKSNSAPTVPSGYSSSKEAGVKQRSYSWVEKKKELHNHCQNTYSAYDKGVQMMLSSTLREDFNKELLAKYKPNQTDVPIKEEGGEVVDSTNSGDLTVKSSNTLTEERNDEIFPLEDLGPPTIQEVESNLSKIIQQGLSTTAPLQIQSHNKTQHAHEGQSYDYEQTNYDEPHSTEEKHPTEQPPHGQDEELMFNME